MISTFTAFIDANVFYGARLRSLVLHLADTKMFRARWSAVIHREWIDNLLQNRPDLTRQQLEKTQAAMDGAVLDALVNGYENLIDGLQLPDPNDRHVLAAAIKCQASCIVTFDLRHFPDDVLNNYGLHAVHPDEFLLDIEGISNSNFIRAVNKDFKHYIRPKLELEHYLGSLRKAGIPKTADKIEDLAVLIDASLANKATRAP